MTRPGQGHLPLSVGSVFGGTDGRRFEILKEAGRGGQAVVFKAMDTRLSRPLALKLCVAPDGAARRLFMERFERELFGEQGLGYFTLVVESLLIKYGHELQKWLKALVSFELLNS